MQRRTVVINGGNDVGARGESVAGNGRPFAADKASAEEK